MFRRLSNALTGDRNRDCRVDSTHEVQHNLAGGKADGKNGEMKLQLY